MEGNITSPDQERLGLARCFREIHFRRISEGKNVISMREFSLCARLRVCINGWIFADRLNKKGYELCVLSQLFPVSSNILTLPMEASVVEPEN